MSVCNRALIYQSLILSSHVPSHGVQILQYNFALHFIGADRKPYRTASPPPRSLIFYQITNKIHTSNIYYQVVHQIMHLLIINWKRKLRFHLISSASRLAVCNTSSVGEYIFLLDSIDIYDAAVARVNRYTRQPRQYQIKSASCNRLM